ncbi:MAG: hypothetical protein AVDCRST_MAG54-3361, partial [uncultured Actinomycetospora sp.]
EQQQPRRRERQNEQEPADLGHDRLLRRGA